MAETHPKMEADKTAPVEPPYVVFCMEIDPEPYVPQQDVAELVAQYPDFPADHYHGITYQHFVHEGDALLGALGGAVANGAMTASAAYEAFRPYQHLYPELYEDRDEEDDEYFPRIGFEYDRMPLSERFWAEAEAVQSPGVGTDLGMPSPASGMVFSVLGTAAFNEIRARLQGRYIIVPGAGDYIGDDDVAYIRRRIAEARAS